MLRALSGQHLAIASRRGITSLCRNVYKTNRLPMAFHARLGFQVTRENAKGVEFTASVSELLAKSRESLAQEVLELPPDVRSKLPDRVDESLDIDRARDAAWDASAAQRDAEIESGAVQPVPVAEVLARLRAELE